MKNNYSQSEFLKSNLPKTRNEQTKDLIRNNFGLLLKIGLLLMLCFLPQIFVFLIKENNINSIVMSFNKGEITQKESTALLSTTYLIFNGVQFISIFIIFFGICGVLRILRVTYWNEGLFFFGDFFKGIKNNIKRTIFYSLFMSMLLFLKDELYFLMCVRGFSGADVINNIILILVIIIFIPILFMMMEIDNYYNHSIGDCFINAFKILVGKYFLYLVAVIPFFLIYLKLLLNPIILLPIYVVFVLFISPFILLWIHGTTLKTFDVLINTHHPEILNKGLYLEDNLK